MERGIQSMKTKTFLMADNGKLSHVVEYPMTGARIEVPINSDGTVKWYEDKRKAAVSQGNEGD